MKCVGVVGFECGRRQNDTLIKLLLGVPGIDGRVCNPDRFARLGCHNRYGPI
jgi:hypothetical protein